MHILNFKNLIAPFCPVLNEHLVRVLDKHMWYIVNIQAINSYIKSPKLNQVADIIKINVQERISMLISDLGLRVNSFAKEIGATQSTVQSKKDGENNSQVRKVNLFNNSYLFTHRNSIFCPFIRRIPCTVLDKHI